MQGTPPLRVPIALFLTAMTTLMLELALTRVFDVILTPNLAYMVIACTLFAFGLAGVYATLRAPPEGAGAYRYVAWTAVLLAVATLLLRPVLNLLPFDYEAIPDRPLLQLLAFAGMYLAMVVPFFLAGLVFTVLFTVHASSIQRLYCWDLAGAALGCVVLIPLLPPIGPGGVLFAAAACNLATAALLATRPSLRVVAALGAVVLAAVPLAHWPDYLGFRDHLDKRGVRAAREAGLVEHARWDPVSKIDVIAVPHDPVTSDGEGSSELRHVAYDGGNQSSHIYPFDGDFARLRRAMERGEESVFDHFWHRGVIASHLLRRDSGAQVLVIGAAAGQETKAALTWGAAHIDAIELVPTVVELGLGRYAGLNGGLFHDPRVDFRADEGRAFLRASDARYDIIQIHSNQTSSSIAAGTGAMAPDYLQTADAFREYFEKLAPDGILHVNHHTYPRMVTTAALAWKQIGRDDFQRHVLVFEFTNVRDTLPTMLIKMTPWSAAEVAEIAGFMTRPWTAAERSDLRYLFEAEDVSDINVVMVENPLEPAASFLDPAFYSGDLDETLVAAIPYQVRPTTDDRPFFRMIRKQAGPITPDPERFVSVAIAQTLNSQLRGDLVAMDVVHLQVTAAVSLLFALAFIVVPLRFAPIGRADWHHRAALVVYFACLGAGFIIIELVFVQIFMKLIGVPLYTYAAVIFMLLLSAGIGSLASARLGITPQRRWTWPFAGVVGYGLALVAAHGAVFDLFLAAPVGVRIAAACALIFPLGFFLGMPFPLGILAVAGRARGTVAWAWGLNGLFTVIGSLASVLVALWIGFKATVLMALGIYVLAALVFPRLRAP